MNDCESYVFERVFNGLRSKYNQIAITDEEAFTPSSLPCVSLVMADNTRYEQSNDSSNDEKYSSVMFEANVYTSGKNKKKQSKEIFNDLDLIMKSIGLQRMMYAPNTQFNSTLQRITARYRAVVDKNNNFYWR